MKKAVSLFLCFVMLFTLFGCSGKKDGDGTSSESTTASVNAVPLGEGSATLMVYMVGSDLESRGGAATADLEEMAESGIDLTKANVVVLAGGSKKWHNDNVNADEGLSVLSLTEDGFTNVAAMDEASMGSSESLSSFLEYSYENYPADSYSLIMWDHGNGPLIGYGKDMLFENDSMTLSEMKEALENSPFSSDNKLSWVGFDACLMASAELSIVWKDHAEYLIASQEIEPSFGWDYSFLSALTGDKDTLFETITGNYLDTCEAYYEKKGFDNRDTTLSCMDLSYSDELETAINDLFKKAASDVDGSFNSLSVSRANTRALGRASTGSEYDLIDINDMASQMAEDYPDEAKAIQDVLGKMTVSNKTNAEDLCGMSIYYPFYNKSYYEDSWGEVYSELGVLSDYADYLSSYTEIWLDDDKLEETAESNEPEQTDDNKFTLELTDAQAENYVSSRFFILSQKGKELYMPIFVSRDIELNGNVLTANWDNEILYAKNGLGNYMIPGTTQHDTVGDITRYSCYVNLTNSRMDSFGEEPEGYEHKVEGHRFHIAANTKTKEISTSALVPYTEAVDGNSLMGGKLEDADLSQWSTYVFPNQPLIYLARYENGAVMPLSEWKEYDMRSGYETRIGDGLEFLFAPLASGEYSLVFEVTDTQGNRYCSELIDFTASGSIVYAPEPEEPIEVSWTEGDSVVLLDEQGVKLELTTMDYYGTEKYTIKATNSNDFAVSVGGGTKGYNEEVYCQGFITFISVQPGESAIYSGGISFTTETNLGLLNSETFESMQFSMYVATLDGVRTLIKEKWFSVTFSDETNIMPAPEDAVISPYYSYDLPANGILAPEQILFEDGDLKITLLGLGGNGEEDIKGAIKVENYSGSKQSFDIQGFVFDGIYIGDGRRVSVPAGATFYDTIYISYDDMEQIDVISPSSIDILLRFYQSSASILGVGGFSEIEGYPVKLSQKGSGCKPDMGDELIYDENSVRVYIKEITYADMDDEYDDYDRIIFTVENNSGYDIHIQPGNYHLNSEYIEVDLFSPVFSTGTGCPDGTVSLFKMSVAKDYADSITVDFDLSVTDFSEESVLFSEAEKTITIKLK